MNAINTVTLLHRDSVIQMTGLSKSSIYTKTKAGLFPTSIHLSARRVIFVSTEIEAYMKAIIQEVSTAEMKILIAELILKRKEC